MAIAEKPPATRLEWLDLFRGLAVVWMIETHVANTFLRPELRETAWFGWLNYANGLVAPAFLFIAGYVLGLQSRPVISHRKFPWKKLRRLGEVALVGYALHFPWDKIVSRNWSGAALSSMWVVDILQCLAVSLGMLVLVNHAAGKWRMPAVGAVFAFAVVVAPSASGWSVGFVPFDAYVNQNAGSLFPLFPWAGFVFGGFLLSRLPPRAMFLLPLAAVLAVMAILIPRTSASTVDPIFFVERLSWLIAMVVCMPVIDRWCSPEWLRLAGRQSLAMYVAHLLMIYVGVSSFGSLATRIGGTLGIGAAAALFSITLMATLGLARLQEWRWRMRVKR